MTCWHCADGNSAPSSDSQARSHKAFLQGKRSLEHYKLKGKKKNPQASGYFHIIFLISEQFLLQNISVFFPVPCLPVSLPQLHATYQVFVMTIPTTVNRVKRARRTPHIHTYFLHIGTAAPRGRPWRTWEMVAGTRTLPFLQNLFFASSSSPVPISMSCIFQLPTIQNN